MQFLEALVSTNEELNLDDGIFDEFTEERQKVSRISIEKDVKVVEAFQNEEKLNPYELDLLVPKDQQFLDYDNFLSSLYHNDAFVVEQLKEYYGDFRVDPISSHSSPYHCFRIYRSILFLYSQLALVRKRKRFQIRQQHIDTLGSEIEIKSNEYVTIPAVVTIGLGSNFAMLRSVVKTLPEEESQVLDLLVTMLANLHPLDLHTQPHEVLRDFQNFLSTTTELKDTSRALTAMISLSIAQGTMESIISAVFALLKRDDDNLVMIPNNLRQLMNIASVNELSVLLSEHFQNSTIVKHHFEGKTTICSDGQYLYIYSDHSGIAKVGSGYQYTEFGKVYQHNFDITNQFGMKSEENNENCSWISYSSGKIYIRTFASSIPGIFVVNKDTLQVEGQILASGQGSISSLDNRDCFAFSNISDRTGPIISNEKYLLFLEIDDDKGSIYRGISSFTNNFSLDNLMLYNVEKKGPNTYQYASGNCGLVRGMNPLSRTSPSFQFEVVDTTSLCVCGIGIVESSYPVDKFPGWKQHSVAYHLDDGSCWSNAEVKQTVIKGSKEDIVECTLIFDGDRAKKAIFKNNSVVIWSIILPSEIKQWYPAIAIGDHRWPTDKPLLRINIPDASHIPEHNQTKAIAHHLHKENENRKLDENKLLLYVHIFDPTNSFKRIGSYEVHGPSKDLTNSSIITRKPMSWGHNSFYELGNGLNVHIHSPSPFDPRDSDASNCTWRSCAAGNNNSFWISTGGQVYACGSNEYGQLGIGNINETRSLSRVLINSPVATVSPPFSGHHTLFLTTTGQVYSTGTNSNGVLGYPISSSVKEPIRIPKFSELPIILIHAGYYKSGALDASGKLYTWGYDNHGQCGHGAIGENNNKYLIPTLVTAIKEPIQSFSFGADYIMILTRDGTLYGAGQNNSLQQGYPNKQSRHVLTKIPVDKLPKNDVIVDVKCGSYHTLLLTKNGVVLSAGSASQLGKPKSESVNQKGFDIISYLKGVHITRIATGATFSAATSIDNNTYFWGSNSFGELGLGTTSATNIPTIIPILRAVPILHLSLGYYHTLIIPDTFQSPLSSHCFSNSSFYSLISDNTNDITNKSPHYITLAMISNHIQSNGCTNEVICRTFNVHSGIWSSDVLCGEKVPPPPLSSVCYSHSLQSLFLFAPKECSISRFSLAFPVKTSDKNDYIFKSINLEKEDLQLKSAEKTWATSSFLSRPSFALFDKSVKAPSYVFAINILGYLDMLAENGIFHLPINDKMKQNKQTDREKEISLYFRALCLTDNGNLKPLLEFISFLCKEIIPTLPNIPDSEKIAAHMFSLICSLKLLLVNISVYSSSFSRSTVLELRSFVEDLLNSSYFTHNSDNNINIIAFTRKVRNLISQIFQAGFRIFLPSIQQKKDYLLDLLRRLRGNDANIPLLISVLSLLTRDKGRAFFILRNSDCYSTFYDNLATNQQSNSKINAPQKGQSHFNVINKGKYNEFKEKINDLYNDMNNISLDEENTSKEWNKFWINLLPGNFVETKSHIDIWEPWQTAKIIKIDTLSKRVLISLEYMPPRGIELWIDASINTLAPYRYHISDLCPEYERFSSLIEVLLDKLLQQIKTITSSKSITSPLSQINSSLHNTIVTFFSEIHSDLYQNALNRKNPTKDLNNLRLLILYSREIIRISLVILEYSLNLLGDEPSPNTALSVLVVIFKCPFFSSLLFSIILHLQPFLTDSRITEHFLPVVSRLTIVIAKFINLCKKNEDIISHRKHLIIESDHPYSSEGSRKIYRAEFTDDVKCISVNFDDRSCTFQSEDWLQVYSQDPRSTKLSYYSQRMLGNSPWNVHSLLIPSNRVFFEFQTASAYPNIPLTDHKVDSLWEPVGNSNNCLLSDGGTTARKINKNSWDVFVRTVEEYQCDSTINDQLQWDITIVKQSGDPHGMAIGIVSHDQKNPNLIPAIVISTAGTDYGMKKQPTFRNLQTGDVARLSVDITQDIVELSCEDQLLGKAEGLIRSLKYTSIHPAVFMFYINQEVRIDTIGPPVEYVPLKNCNTQDPKLRWGFKAYLTGFIPSNPSDPMNKAFLWLSRLHEDLINFSGQVALSKGTKMLQKGPLEKLLEGGMLSTIDFQAHRYLFDSILMESRQESSEKSHSNNLLQLDTQDLSELFRKELPTEGTSKQHPHLMQKTDKRTSWKCDGERCNALNPMDGRWRCTNGCDYDLCKKCWSNEFSVPLTPPMAHYLSNNGDNLELSNKLVQWAELHSKEDGTFVSLEGDGIKNQPAYAEQECTFTLKIHDKYSLGNQSQGSGHVVQISLIPTIEWGEDRAVIDWSSEITWRQEKNMPFKQSEMASATGLDQNVYLFGGKGPLDKAWKYNLNTDEFTSLPKLQRATANAQAALLADGRIVITAGSVDNVQIYNPFSSTQNKSLINMKLGRGTRMTADHFIPSTKYSNLDIDNLCTFLETRSEYKRQPWYRCITCNLVGNNGVCARCVKECHKGHNTVYAQESRFFCDCGNGDGPKKCSIIGPAKENTGILHFIGGNNSRKYAQYNTIYNQFVDSSFSLSKDYKGHGVAMDHRKRLYVFGGESDSMEILDTISRCNWTPGPKLPIKMVNFSYTTDPEGHYLIVCGGEKKLNKEYSDKVYVFDFDKQEWSLNSTVLPGGGIIGHCICIARNELHCFGGSKDKGEQHLIGIPSPKLIHKKSFHIEPIPRSSLYNFSVTDNKDNTYTIKYTPHYFPRGNPFIKIQISGKTIDLSPLKLNVQPSTSIQHNTEDLEKCKRNLQIIPNISCSKVESLSINQPLSNLFVALIVRLGIDNLLYHEISAITAEGLTKQLENTEDITPAAVTLSLWRIASRTIHSYILKKNYDIKKIENTIFSNIITNSRLLQNLAGNTTCPNNLSSLLPLNSNPIINEVLSIALGQRLESGLVSRGLTHRNLALSSLISGYQLLHHLIDQTVIYNIDQLYPLVSLFYDSIYKCSERKDHYNRISLGFNGCKIEQINQFLVCFMNVCEQLIQVLRMFENGPYNYNLLEFIALTLQVFDYLRNNIQSTKKSKILSELQSFRDAFNSRYTKEKQSQQHSEDISLEDIQNPWLISNYDRISSEILKYTRVYSASDITHIPTIRCSSGNNSIENIRDGNTLSSNWTTDESISSGEKPETIIHWIEFEFKDPVVLSDICIFNHKTRARIQVTYIDVLIDGVKRGSSQSECFRNTGFISIISSNNHLSRILNDNIAPCMTQLSKSNWGEVLSYEDPPIFKGKVIRLNLHSINNISVYQIKLFGYFNTDIQCMKANPFSSLSELVRLRLDRILEKDTNDLKNEFN